MAQDVQRRDAIRIQVIKCAGLYQPEYKTFSVDPEITHFPMLHNLLSQAFQLQSEFTISYLSRDEKGVEVYLSLLSNWDLDAAFLSASDPVLKLKVDARPFKGPGLDDWDVISMKDTSYGPNHQRSMSVPFVGTLIDSVGRTFNRVQKIFQSDVVDGKVYELPLKPLDDKEFLTYLDEGGRLINKEGLMLRVFQGGVEPSLRKTVWRHLLNIFPPSMSGEERWEYLKRKDNEYRALKERLLNNPREDFKNVMNMVRKDVLRTDRLESFYSTGADENPNSAKLFNILTTYALSHPDVSYCQGMSDLASPILYVMQDEAQAYLCFVGLMMRLRGNFLMDGKTMSVKFLHLTELIKVSDPEFYSYLREENADDLYFCYRWLLLELKREFAFQDALRMLEVMWSAVPPHNPPSMGIELSGPPSNMSPTAFATDKMRFKFARERSNSKRRSGSFSRLRSVSVESDDGLKLSQKEFVSSQDVDVFKEDTTANETNYELNCTSNSLTGTSNHNKHSDKNAKIMSFIEEKTKQEIHNNPVNIEGCYDKINEHDNETISTKTSPRRVLPKVPSSPSLTLPVAKTKTKSSALHINCQTNCETISDNNYTSMTSPSSSNSLPDLVLTTCQTSTCSPSSFTPSRCTTSVCSTTTCSSLVCTTSTCSLSTCSSSTCSTSTCSLSTCSPSTCSTSTCSTSSCSLSTCSPSTCSTSTCSPSTCSPSTCLTTSTCSTSTCSTSTCSTSKSSTRQPLIMTNNTPSEKDTNHSTSQHNNPSKLSPSKNVQMPPSTSLHEKQSKSHNNKSASQKSNNASPRRQSNSRLPFVLSSLEKRIAELTTTTKPASLPLHSQQTEPSKMNISPTSPVRRPYRGLPTPRDFGMGNPFMMFLCLTLLLEQRECIMALKMDYNDMAMLFDRMVRKHDLNRMLCKARDLYIDYLKAEISFGYWEEELKDGAIKLHEESYETHRNGEVALNIV